ncbi:hypothetical protein FGADI_10117 [Fusarium gaditjirri]|uniref:Uncharacterized protein n=1 Tax=Fusarium gaditjirri TaxID=282569 RepID=A0A8H4WR73_9HYPO|nr:hypothetical protein FGADI_10117 [Fusarium gaditjirri]
MAQFIPHFQTSARPPPPQATRDTVTTPQGTTVVTSWNRLSGEIRHYILGFLSHQNRRKHIYAAVYREWRTFMEEKNFGNLTICRHGLTGLENLGPQSRTAIRHLWFNMHLTGMCLISHGHAIRLLELPPQVIDLESREQIEKEYKVADIPGVHRTPLAYRRLN